MANKNVKLKNEAGDYLLPQSKLALLTDVPTLTDNPNKFLHLNASGVPEWVSAASDNNQTVKVGTSTFGANAAVNFVGGGATSVSATTTSGSEAITISTDISGKQDTLAAKGSTTKPIYTSAAGTIAECSTYAGGTAITLNGTSKAASTASFYAPTSAISTTTATRYLVGTSSTTSVATENTNASCYMSNGYLYSNNKPVLTDHQDISGKVNKSGDTMTGTLNMSDADIYFSGSDYPGICFNDSAENRIWYDPDGDGKIALMTNDSNPIYLSSSGIELGTAHLNLSGIYAGANGVEMYSTAGTGCTTYICSGSNNATQSIKFGANSSGNFAEFADFTYTIGATPTYKLTVNNQFIAFGSSGLTGSNSFSATSSTLTTSGKIATNTFIYSQLCTIYGLPSSAANYIRVYESTSSSSTTGGTLVAVAQGGYYSTSAVGDCRVTFRMKPGYYYYVAFSGLKYYSGASASNTGVSIKRWPDM